MKKREEAKMIDNYHVLNGCHNCKLVSVLLLEHVPDIYMCHTALPNWDARKIVSPAGMCDKWQKKEENADG